jgi:CHAT domain-containing protein
MLRLELKKPYRVLAFATHAVSRSPAFRRPRPAIVLTPGRATLSTNDGLLHSEEIEEMSLDAEMVILSACQTAGGSGLAGAEALSGLAQAFLYAGSRSVVATQWKVESNSASAQMAKLEVERRTLKDPAVRLRRAALQVRANRKWTHPAFWAPFVLIESTIGGQTAQ